MFLPRTNFMKILELSGLDPEIGKQFFDSLNNILNIESQVDYFAWQNFYNPRSDNENKLKLLVNNLAKHLKDLLATESAVTIYARSYGSFIAEQAIKLLQNEYPELSNTIEIKLSIFGAPYRLDFPPKVEILDSPPTVFDDQGLAESFLKSFAELNIETTIYQGTKDDLGPITPLVEAAKHFPIIKTVSVPDETHNLNPKNLAHQLRD